MTDRSAGVTASEFARLCVRDWHQSNAVPPSSIGPFLERCCALGLLTTHKGSDGVMRYAPTALLLAAFSNEAHGD